MRVAEKSAEAVLAEKPRNGGGAKGRRTKYKELEKRLETGARSGSNHWSNNYGSQLVSATDRAVKPQPTRRDEAMPVLCEPFDGERMYETLMETAVTDENCAQALVAVKRNQGAAGIDRMTTAQLDSHLQANWWILKDKLLKGTYVPSPVRRVEIPKPNGGTRMLGIPTVQDRFIQQLLLQALTPIFDPNFSEHSYGFRPGRSAQDAMRAAQQYAQEGKDWVVDIDITKFLDTASYCPPGS